MGILNAIPYAGYQSPWANLRQRYGQHEGEHGAGGDMPKGPMPPAPDKAPASFWDRLNTGFQGLESNPMFTMGLSLLGNAQNGGDWSGVLEDMQGMGDRRRQQQILDNEMRRQKTGDARDQERYTWEQQDRTRDADRRSNFDRYVQSLPEDQRGEFGLVNPDQAADYILGRRQMDANQRNADRDFSLRERALAIEASRDRPIVLRGSDRALMDRVQEGADQSSNLEALGRLFLEQNRTTGTGPETRVNPWRAMGFDAGARNLVALSNQMRGLARPPGSGATSDFEQRLYGDSVMSPYNPPEANQRIYENILALRDLARARQYFLEDYARANNGSLLGADRAFEQSPDFQAIRARIESRANAPEASPRPRRSVREMSLEELRRAAEGGE